MPRHHYVPQWYQKRFLPAGVTNFFYLDLHPETRTWATGSHQLKAVRHLGAAACFYEDNLYTLKFGKQISDEMERLFFGRVDSLGSEAVQRIAEFSGITKGFMDAFRNVPSYMGAQRFRTPRGLDEVRRRAATSNRQNATMMALREIFQSYSTMWTEGVWEIVRARQSPTKFIVTDDPVTLYCRIMFPSEWIYPNDASLKQVGTRTIFPLSIDSCLILTHLQLTRMPWTTPTAFRDNARFYDDAIKFVGDIQFGRELEENEVLRINYILKRRASRYVAAAREEWLYPEHRVSVTDWTKLDDDWFLFPNLWKIGFTTEIAAGFQDGSTWASDEYGRRPGHPAFSDKKQHEVESLTRDLAQKEWAKKRVGRSLAHVDNQLGSDDVVGDKLLRDYLIKEGLLSSQPEKLP
jgi:hypothetical protein